MSTAAPEDDPIATGVQRFVDHLRHERRLSPHTVSGYSRDLAALGAFMRERGTVDWQTLTPWDLRAFAADAHRHGLHPRSIARRLSAARSLFRYLRREGLLDHDPAADVRPPKAPRRLPATLDADAMASLLGRLEDGPLGLRDRAILELMYSSGLRLAELTGLSLTDIDLADATVRVTGKGSRGRILPVGRQAREALAAWLKARGALAAEEETALFVSRHGRRLSPRAVQLRVRRWARLAGAGVPVHPHLLRHSFASHLLESSGDLRGVQELLGHANIATTQVYTHLDFQHLARIYDRSHPRAKRRGPAGRD